MESQTVQKTSAADATTPPDVGTKAIDGNLG
jgi:hypothetical protein